MMKMHGQTTPKLVHKYYVPNNGQSPRGLRLGSVTAHLLGLQFRIPPDAWISVSYVCCVLFGTVLCVEMITRPVEA